MHPEDLKTLWICHECVEVFFFHSDVDEHKSVTGHEKIAKRANAAVHWLDS